MSQKPAYGRKNCTHMGLLPYQHGGRSSHLYVVNKGQLLQATNNHLTDKCYLLDTNWQPERRQKYNRIGRNAKLRSDNRERLVNTLCTANKKPCEYIAAAENTANRLSINNKKTILSIG